jgi:hypothetical protein
MISLTPGGGMKEPNRRRSPLFVVHEKYVDRAEFPTAQSFQARSIDRASAVAGMRLSAATSNLRSGVASMTLFLENVLQRQAFATNGVSRFLGKEINKVIPPLLPLGSLSSGRRVIPCGARPARTPASYP